MSQASQCRYCYGNKGPWFLPSTRHRRGICLDCESRAKPQERAHRVVKLKCEAGIERVAQPVCKVCYSLAHRRPLDGCKACGGAHEAERIDVSLGSRDAWNWANFEHVGAGL